MTEAMSPELTQIITLRDAFITQFGAPPSVMTLTPAHVTALNLSPWFKRSTFSSVGTLGVFMGMTIRAGSPMQAMDASGANTLEIGEISDA